MACAPYHWHGKMCASGEPPGAAATLLLADPPSGISSCSEHVSESLAGDSWRLGTVPDPCCDLDHAWTSHGNELCSSAIFETKSLDPCHVESAARQCPPCVETSVGAGSYRPSQNGPDNINAPPRSSRYESYSRPGHCTQDQ